jgi:hypothetical protein
MKKVTPGGVENYATTGRMTLCLSGVLHYNMHR